MLFTKLDIVSIIYLRLLEDSVATRVYKYLWGVCSLQFALLAATHPFIITLTGSIYLLKEMPSLQLSSLQLGQNCGKTCWISDEHNNLIAEAVHFYEV